MSYFHWKYNQLSSALRRFTVLFGMLLSLEIQPTIIGAKAFHCPVRNGKEWDHPAMVARLSLLSRAGSWPALDEFFSVSQSVHGLCFAVLSFFEQQAVRL